MASWPPAERRKWTRRLMLPHHWISISEAEQRRDLHRYVSYREAMGQECPALFPILAKDLSQRDLAHMSF